MQAKKLQARELQQSYPVLEDEVEQGSLSWIEHTMVMFVILRLN